MRGSREGFGAAWVTAAVTIAIATCAPAVSHAQTAEQTCAGLSPIAAPCVGVQKVVDATSELCRQAGAPDTQCALPLSRGVTATARDAYLKSWVHRAAQLQYRLQDGLPLTRAQWVGTHNSFNSLAEGLTLSHSDSNQQLTLAQQLDVDVRALELDIHFIPSVSAGGARVPVVCHGQGPDSLDLGCTTEQPLTAVLPEITSWLRAHADQVVLLYLEDEMKAGDAYPVAVRQIEDAFRRANGSSMLLHPDPAAANAKGCVDLPLSLTRNAVRAAGAQVVLVGNCVKGWASIVHGWDDVHVESGSTAAYGAFPRCDATYPRAIYDTRLVRYYEDSTLVSAAVNPTTPAPDPERLTPQVTAAMTGCGVSLFGFDQLLPQDGRLEATIWSWARDEPDAAHGACTAQRSDGRWERRGCATRLRAACRTASGWRISPKAVKYSAAAAACRALGGRLDLPRDGYDNSLLHQAAGNAAAWLKKS